MAILTLNLNGVTSIIDTARPLSGGVSHSDLGGFLTTLVSAVAPNVATVACADNATVNLVSVFNTVRTTSDGTIANAVFNFPTSPTDGELCVFVTTGAVSNVTGTVNTRIPNVVSTAAGTRIQSRYDALTSTWLAA